MSRDVRRFSIKDWFILLVNLLAVQASRTLVTTDCADFSVERSPEKKLEFLAIDQTGLLVNPFFCRHFDTMCQYLETSRLPDDWAFQRDYMMTSIDGAAAFSLEKTRVVKGKGKHAGKTCARLGIDNSVGGTRMDRWERNEISSARLSKELNDEITADYHRPTSIKPKRSERRDGNTASVFVGADGQVSYASNKPQRPKSTPSIA